MFVDPSGLYYFDGKMCLGILAEVGLNAGMLLNITLGLNLLKCPDCGCSLYFVPTKGRSTEDSLNKISESLPREKSWFDDIIQYGNLEETCLEISYENGRVSEISCRIDIRSCTKEIFDAIIYFINMNEAVILSGGVFYEVNNKVMKEIIKNSNAYRFCENPIEYLDKINSDFK